MQFAEEQSLLAAGLCGLLGGPACKRLGLAYKPANEPAYEWVRVGLRAGSRSWPVGAWHGRPRWPRRPG
jgi:hypothetical protein